MCLATLGKIEKIKNNNIAEADFGGVVFDIKTELVEVKPGDYVMVHAGFAIQKVEISEYEEVKKLKL